MPKIKLPPKNLPVPPGTVEALTFRLAKLAEERKQFLEQIDAAVDDVLAAGRVFGVELNLPAALQATPAKTDSDTAQAQLFQPAEGEISIRDAVIEQLRKAGPKGMKAGPLRQILEAAMGRSIHYKTIGVTLYRMQKKGLVTREGLVWHPTPKLLGGNGNPGVLSAGVKEGDKTGSKEGSSFLE